MPIRMLSDKVSSMIAAGEVVERPASVVKELVENALDAGSSEISVEIRGGGVEQIRVADNGIGIPHDEVELAFQRFATSKLSDASDLDAIPTLGFRGEALPSIASVARVSVVTRHIDDEAGTRLEVDEGRISEKQRQGASPGTVMTVSRLFRNVPARRKFLRTAATETSHIQNMVTRYALAYPEVRFALNTGRSSLLTPGSGSLQEAIAAVYSLNVAEGMLDIAHPDADGYRPEVVGMVGKPEFSRANRGYMSFFVNRRWVQSRMLGYALEQAYHGFLKERRYPMAVVNISLDYGEVDVNVHPSKTEVRFRNGDRVFSAIQQAVRQTLTAHSPVPEIRRAEATSPAYPYPSAPRQPSRHFWPIEPFNPSPVAAPDRNGEHATDLQDSAPIPGIGDANGFTPKQTLPMLRVLGQVQATYIAAEGPDGMYLIDQHAAHERVMFERIKADAAASAPQSQSLMEPLTVELNARQQELAQANANVFASLGLLVEPFGGDVYIMRAVPSILTDADPAKAFIDMLDEMAQGGDVESWDDRAAYSLACHAAIRAGQGHDARRDDGADPAAGAVQSAAYLPARTADDNSPERQSVGAGVREAIGTNRMYRIERIYHEVRETVGTNRIYRIERIYHEVRDFSWGSDFAGGVAGASDRGQRGAGAGGARRGLRLDMHGATLLVRAIRAAGDAAVSGAHGSRRGRYAGCGRRDSGAAAQSGRYCGERRHDGRHLRRTLHIRRGHRLSRRRVRRLRHQVE